MVMAFRDILIPINYDGTHWLVLHMNIGENYWVFYDSLKNCLGNKKRSTVYKVCVFFI